MIDVHIRILRGRVLTRDETGFHWLIGAKRSAVTCNSSIDISMLKAGDWVEAEGVEDGDSSFVANNVRILQPYPGQSPFPPVDSDWYRFHKEEGLLFWQLEKRAVVLRAVRHFFEENGFLEVDTPAMALSPGLETHLDAVEARLQIAPETKRESRWLVTSPEYHMKRLLSAGFERIFQMGKAFRSGESGRWHNPEFTMLEWYRAFATWEEGLEDTLCVIEAAARALTKDEDASMGLDLSRPWPRMTVREAIIAWAGFDPAPWEDADDLRKRALGAGVPLSEAETTAADILVRTLVEKVEPAIPTDRPFILTEYPDCMASLAQRSPTNPTVAERFEVYLAGIEIANGFGELVDPNEQRQRCLADQNERKRLGLPIYPVDERFLSALNTGCPPSTGIALGIDRLLLCLTKATSIDEAMAFPIEVA